MKCLRTGKHNKCLGWGLIVFRGIHNQEVPEDKVFWKKGEEKGSKAAFSSWRFVSWLLFCTSFEKNSSTSELTFITNIHLYYVSKTKQALFLYVSKSGTGSEWIFSSEHFFRVAYTKINKEVRTWSSPPALSKWLVRSNNIKSESTQFLEQPETMPTWGNTSFRL